MALLHATRAWPNFASLIGFVAISPDQLTAVIGNPDDAFGDDTDGSPVGTYSGRGG
jgi:hypothetical protein